MPDREHRLVPTREVRVAEDGHTVEAVVLAYNVVDDYNTRFRPGVFADSLKERMPRMVWAHDWTDPVGRWVDYRDTDETLTLIGELDDFDAVPRARQASAQLRSGTIDQFSVGFIRESDETVDPEEVDGRKGIVDITKGQLDEASLVLRGAVPGTQLLAVRSAPEASVDDAVELARRIAEGEITVDQAKAALALLGHTSTDVPIPEPDPEPVEPEPQPEPVADLDIDAALALVADRARVK